MTDEHKRDLALQLHVAAMQLPDAEACDRFTRIMMIVTMAMETEGTHDQHSRTLLRTVCIMLEKVCKGAPMTESVTQYCKRVAYWIDRWVHDGRITYASFVQAKAAAKNIDKQDFQGVDHEQ